MLYLTTAAPSLLSYLVSRERRDYQYFYNPNAAELEEITHMGSPITPAVAVVEYKGKAPKALAQSIFNDTYISTSSLTSWKPYLEKDWVKEIEIHPELFKGTLAQFKSIFEPDAYDYFWEKFKNAPRKIDIELKGLITKFANRGSSKIPFSKEDLEMMFCPEISQELFTQYPKNIGTIEGQNIINQLPDSSLWTLFIGSESRPPFIYYSLSKKGCPELYVYLIDLHKAVRNQQRDLRAACCLFNSWVQEVGYPNFCPTAEQQELWQQLIYLI